MRLATSTIVMTVLTSIPFGLAIRDTIRHPASDGRGPGDDAARRYDNREMDDEAIDAYAAEQARIEANEEQVELELLGSHLRELYGAEPATLGTLFTGDRDAIEDRIRIRTFSAQTNIDVTTSIDRRGLTTITATPRPNRNHDRACELLSSQLEDAWGPSTDSALGAHWLSPSGHRASLVGSDNCALIFDRFVPADKLINKSPTSIIPLWAIGLPRNKLTDNLIINGPDADRDGVNAERVEWDAPGVGASLGSTRLTAYFKQGKVVTVTAAANASAAGIEEVVEQITQVTKVEPTGDDVRRWKSRPAIEVAVDRGTSLLVTIGASQE